MAKASGTIDMKSLKEGHDDASTKATAYITAIDQNGIKVHAENNPNLNYTKINAEGMEVHQNVSGTDTIVASFGSSGSRIGRNANGKSRTEIGSSGMQIIQKANNTDTQIANLGYGQGTSIDGGTSTAPYYTLGRRLNGSTVGNYSFAEGIDTTAKGYASHASGVGTIARNRQFVIGEYNIEDTDDKYSFIIGGGYLNSDENEYIRKNLLTVENITGDITVGNHATPIGYIEYVGTTGTDIYSAANTSKRLLSVRLYNGVWVVQCQARFQPSASGANYTAISFNETSASTAWHDRRHSNGAYATQHNLTTIVYVGNEVGYSTYYLNGSTTTAGTWIADNDNCRSIMAVRIV